jgi:exodeoxyribonuclease-5
MFDFMDYGYCITVHKAQGSQWDSVVVRDESWCFKEHSKNWLYTAVTRAAKELVVIK